MSLEIIARKWRKFTETCIGISLHTFLPFDELSHILHLLGLNSVLKPISLPQMQIQCCICKTYYFLLSLIRAISVKKMKMTYFNRNHCWIISQIQMKLLSSAGSRAQLFQICFSFEVFFFFFYEINRSKQGARHTYHYKKKSGGGKQMYEKDCVARKNRLCSDLPYFVFANNFIWFSNSLFEGIISQWH